MVDVEGHPTQTPTANRTFNRSSYVLLLVLLLFLILGAVAGYFAAQSGISRATLLVQVENETAVTQDVRILVNNDQVNLITVPAGQTASVSVEVGWTSNPTGMYEVTAVPVSAGIADNDRVTVTNGQTIVVTLRVG